MEKKIGPTAVARRTEPSKSCFDETYTYVTAAGTDIRKRFAAIKRAAKAAKAVEAMTGGVTLKLARGIK